MLRFFELIYDDLRNKYGFLGTVISVISFSMIIMAIVVFIGHMIEFYSFILILLIVGVGIVFFSIFLASAVSVIRRESKQWKFSKKL